MQANEFYILDFSTEAGIIGNRYPQVVGVISSYVDKPINKYSLYNFSNFKGRQINYIPDLSGLKIGERTRLTDFISCSLGPGRDLIVSSHCLSLIPESSRSQFQIFNCTLNKQKEKFNYKWLHFVYELEEQIDYESSVFYHPNKELNKKVDIIKDYKSLLSFYSQIDKFETLRAKKIILNCSPLDFFIIGRVNQDYYVSKRLKEIFEQEKITGIKYIPAANIFFKY